MPASSPERHHLFYPLIVGSNVIKNRAVMGSMHTGLEHESLEKLKAFYVERAQQEVGMIITGGTAPNAGGCAMGGAWVLSNQAELEKHQQLTNAVHEAAADIKFCLQLLHAGAMVPSPDCVAPSAIKSPVGFFTPRALSSEEIEAEIQSFAHSAQLAQLAGYDGVEIIGSAGYLISTFLLASTNQREDNYGGSYENRMRFAVEVIRRVRQAVGADFIVIFRIGAMELHDQGCSWQEVVQLALAIEAAGASLLSTHFTWHQSRVPTLTSNVPRALFSQVAGRLRQHINIPLIVSNRINTPQQAETILASGEGDLISMARPMLADPAIIAKAKSQREDEINTCIACNQACLDHAFEMKKVSCLVNPRACRETEWQLVPAAQTKRIAVVGSGPAGLAFAVTAAQRGHQVSLFEASTEIGGQFNIAKTIPGKQEFSETLRYYSRQLQLGEVNLHLKQRVSAESLIADHFDEIVLATGITPRKLNIDGIDHPSVINYLDVFSGAKPVGQRVAIIGAGGIGFDMAEWLAHVDEPLTPATQIFARDWGIDFLNHPRGGVAGITPRVAPSPREIFILQRKPGRVGRGLGKTSGWAKRLYLERKGVTMMAGVEYKKIDDQGLHLSIDGAGTILALDNIVICAGQESNQTLFSQLQQAGTTSHLIGGASKASELDAKLAIEQGTQLALSL